MFEPLDVRDFEARTGLKTGFSCRAEEIVSLRDLNEGEVTAVQVMPISYLEALLRNVSLEGDVNVKPYANCEFSLVSMDPRSACVGQTFVERSKYQAILEKFELLDGKFCVNGGAAKRNALIIFGVNKDGKEVMAHYLPPIYEVMNGNDNGHHFLLDGVHRNFLVKQIGTTIESILIKGVKIPLPCDPGTWQEVRVVSEKPPRLERFHNLRPELFRNLKFIGIDG